MAEATSDVMTTTDGVPLKVSLRKAMRRNRIKAVFLVAPLLLFILVTFIIPILEMSWRSVDNPELRGAIPRTLELLDQWDGQALPPEEVYAALAEEMKEGRKNRTIGKVGARLNREVSGSRSLINKTVRKSKNYRAHDPKNEFKTGDKVRIQECAPISKTKRWEVIAS